MNLTQSNKINKRNEIIKQWNKQRNKIIKQTFINYGFTNDIVNEQVIRIIKMLSNKINPATPYSINKLLSNFYSEQMHYNNKLDEKF